MKSAKCYWIHLALAVIGVVFYVFGVISLFFVGDLLGVNHAVNFFICGNSFVLLAIISKLLCKCNRCCCQDEECKCDTETK